MNRYWAALVAVLVVVFSIAIIGVIEKNRPTIKTRQKVVLSDEIRTPHTGVQVNKTQRIRVNNSKHNIGFVEDYEDADPYEVENAMEELLEELERLRKSQSCRDLHNRVKKLENKHENFWSLKDREL